jgi:prophage regulatory protein
MSFSRTLAPQGDGMAAAGCKSTQWYEWISAGLMVKPVAIGKRGRRVVLEEVQAVVDARIAGATDDQIRTLVGRLHDARPRLDLGL